MFTRTLILSILTVAPLAGQTDWFQIYPERNGSAATYVTRGGGGSNQVELTAEIPGDLIAGVGDNGTACEAVGYRFYVVDENPTTPEQYDVVFRQPDPSAQPGTVLARVGPLATPTLTTSTRSTILVSATFATPVALPCQGAWFHGVDLYAANAWPSTDGIALFCAYYYPPASRAVGDNPRAGAPNLAWQVMGGVPSPIGTPLTLRMGPLVRAPVMSAGGIDLANVFQTPNGSPNYGAGGLFPDISGAPRADGINVLVEDSNRIGGSAFAVLGFSLTSIGGLSFPGFGGRLWLNPAVLIAFGPAQINSAAGAAIPILSPGSISPSAMGVQLNYQAIVFGGAAGTIAFSNASGVLF